MLSCPKVLVSNSDGVNMTVLPVTDTCISRKNSKSSLKSNSSVADVSTMKDEIIASMIKKMTELEDEVPVASSPHSSSMTSDQTALLLKAKSEQPLSSLVSEDRTAQRKYSRSHQRRFHRRFPAVHADERLIDWFNCALVAEILLQGYLYISDHYFAFYSNILGYKVLPLNPFYSCLTLSLPQTKVLIPISDVVCVTKEKTARIFPNAVGICTEEAKYVFGSLISREAAYRLLQDVWRTTLYQVLMSERKFAVLIPNFVIGGY